VLKVILADFEFEHFVDHRKEVRQGMHDSQGQSGGGTQQSARCRENQRVFDRHQRHLSLVQLSA
jgi:hypothetical protein